jgi:hypothetical protein
VSAPDAAEAAIRAALARSARSISPEDAARTLDPETWRKRLVDIRAAAIRLAGAGEVTILRKGRPVDPGDFKGVWRIARTDVDG